MGDQKKSMNGSDHPPEQDDLVALEARLGVTSMKADAALRLAERTHTAVEDVHAAILDVRKLTLGLHLAVQRLANESFEMRMGVPTSWRRRLFLVTLGGITGGIAGICAAHFVR